MHLEDCGFEGGIGGGWSWHVADTSLDVEGHQTGDIVDMNSIICCRSSNEVGLSSVDLIGGKEGLRSILVDIEFVS